VAVILEAACPFVSDLFIKIPPGTRHLLPTEGTPCVGSHRQLTKDSDPPGAPLSIDLPLRLRHQELRSGHCVESRGSHHTKRSQTKTSRGARKYNTLNRHACISCICFLQPDALVCAGGLFPRRLLSLLFGLNPAAASTRPGACAPAHTPAHRRQH
jgi:hypothetical protein